MDMARRCSRTSFVEGSGGLYSGLIVRSLRVMWAEAALTPSGMEVTSSFMTRRAAWRAIRSVSGLCEAI